MKGLKYLVLIVREDMTEQYLDFLKEHGAKHIFYKGCVGTSTHTILEMCGLERTAKSMIETVVRDAEVESIKRGLIQDMNLYVNDRGIGFFIPMGSMGGTTALEYFIGEEPLIKPEGENMENKYSLIITVLDKGNSGTAMEVAKTAGATGGTVAKAKGTADIAKFFGATISDEKEMLYIVCLKTARDDIMRALMDNVGANTSAHGIIYSLPVESILGIKKLENI